MNQHAATAHQGHTMYTTAANALALPTLEDVKTLISADFCTGVLSWNGNADPRCRNKTISRISFNGYVVLSFKNRQMYAHRVMWLLVYGHWPTGDLDHINGNKQDNRIENLRVASRLVNNQNLHKAKSPSKCGLLGVEKNHNGWRARIRVGGKRIGLGTFKTPEEAHETYIKAKRELHDGCSI